MTIDPTVQANEAAQAAPTENKNSKEANLEKLRYALENERLEKQRLQQELEAVRRQKESSSRDDEDESDDSSEPYVDHKKLEKKLKKFESKNKQDTASIVQSEVQKALAQERQNMWLKANPDFVEVMQHAQKFADSDPELAETILAMPEGFERQKLVYKNIKALGLHKPKPTQSDIQAKVNQQQRSPYFYNSPIGTPAQSQMGDYTPQGQKSAYEKMQALKNGMRAFK